MIGLALAAVHLEPGSAMTDCLASLTIVKQSGSHVTEVGPIHDAVLTNKLENCLLSIS